MAQNSGAKLVSPAPNQTSQHRHLGVRQRPRVQPGTPQTKKNPMIRSRNPSRIRDRPLPQSGYLAKFQPASAFSQWITGPVVEASARAAKSWPPQDGRASNQMILPDLCAQASIAGRCKAGNHQICLAASPQSASERAAPRPALPADAAVRATSFDRSSSFARANCWLRGSSPYGGDSVKRPPVRGRHGVEIGPLWRFALPLRVSS